MSPKTNFWLWKMFMIGGALFAANNNARDPVAFT